MFLYFTTARDIELEADQKIIEKVEDLSIILKMPKWIFIKALFLN